MKPSLRLPLALLCGALLWLGTVQAQAAKTVRIALAGPVTGPVTQYGEMVRAGALTAIEEINAAGGVAGGYQLEPVILDDACEPKQGVAVANKIVGDGIHFVLGHVCSGPTIPAADIYENEGVLMMTPSATVPQLTEGKPKQMIFRITGLDTEQGTAAGEYIANKAKPVRVAILHDKQSYGQGVASAVKKSLDAAGVPVVLFEGINAGDNDYSAVVTKIKGQGADFVYFGGYHPEMGLLLRLARAQGIKATFMGPEGVSNKDITAIAGEASEGMLLTQPADFAADPANAELVKAFRDKKRDPNGPFQMQAYSGVKIIAEAMNGAKSVDPVEVAEYIHSHHFQTPIGPVDYLPNGDMKAYRFKVFVWHKDGTTTPAE